jgi:hypothetical protein
VSATAIARVSRRLIPFLFLLYILNFLDRVKRARAYAWFLAAIPVCGVIGGPLSGGAARVLAELAALHPTLPVIYGATTGSWRIPGHAASSRQWRRRTGAGRGARWERRPAL